MRGGVAAGGGGARCARAMVLMGGGGGRGTGRRRGGGVGGVPGGGGGARFGAMAMNAEVNGCTRCPRELNKKHKNLSQRSYGLSCNNFFWT